MALQERDEREAAFKAQARREREESEEKEKRDLELLGTLLLPQSIPKTSPQAEDTGARSSTDAMPADIPPMPKRPVPRPPPSPPPPTGPKPPPAHMGGTP